MTFLPAHLQLCMYRTSQLSRREYSKILDFSVLRDKRVSLVVSEKLSRRV